MVSNVQFSALVAVAFLVCLLTFLKVNNIQVKKNQKKQRPAKKLKQVQKRSLGCTDKVNYGGTQWVGDGVTINSETDVTKSCTDTMCDDGWEIYVQPGAGSYFVSLITAGALYSTGDTISVSGDLLGGAPVTNDLTITFTVPQAGATTIIGEGTGVSPIHCHEAINCAITDSDDMTASSACCACEGGGTTTAGTCTNGLMQDGNEWDLGGKCDELDLDPDANDCDYYSTGGLGAPNDPQDDATNVCCICGGGTTTSDSPSPGAR